MSHVMITKPGHRDKRVSKMVWKMLGPNKDGWKLKTASKSTPGAAAGEDAANTEARYRQLKDQAKGFENDRKFDDALDKLNAAANLKPSSHITGEINRVTSLKAQGLIVAGDEFAGDEDYAAALESYHAAAKLTPDDDELTTKIEVTEAKLEG